MSEFTTVTRHRDKVTLAWLAGVLGVFSIHWWYLGRPHAWVMTTFSVTMLVLAQFHPVWWDNVPFLLLFLPVSAGIIEALVFALTTDEKFDARYNPHSGQKTKTGWDAVIAAIVTTFIGGAIMVFGLAMAVIYLYKAMGWLDDYVF